MNWLKSEFNWSISAATKFMQVAEQFSYTRAKAIICHRKTKKEAVELKAALLKPDEPVNVIQPTSYETTSAISAQKDLTEKEAQTEKKRSLLSLEPEHNVAFEDKQIATLAEMAISMKNLKPEELLL